MCGLRLSPVSEWFVTSADCFHCFGEWDSPGSSRSCGDVSHFRKTLKGASICTFTERVGFVYGNGRFRGSEGMFWNLNADGKPCRCNKRRRYLLHVWSDAWCQQLFPGKIELGGTVGNFHQAMNWSTVLSYPWKGKTSLQDKIIL